jgi:hypothetical protein
MNPRKNNGHITTGRVVGYARVSTDGQSLDGQLHTLKAAGAATVYREKISGVRADRPQLAKLMSSLRKGDVVVVTKLDRLGRSTRELLDLIHRIDQAGASFKSLGDPLFDRQRLTGLSPLSRLCLLERGEHRRPSELDACGHCPPSALAGAFADQFTLKLRDGGEHRDQQAAL